MTNERWLVIYMESIVDVALEDGHLFPQTAEAWMDDLRAKAERTERAICTHPSAPEEPAPGWFKLSAAIFTHIPQAKQERWLAGQREELARLRRLVADPQTPAFLRGWVARDHFEPMVPA